jgi:hypothetical protein
MRSAAVMDALVMRIIAAPKPQNSHSAHGSEWT